MRHTNSLMKLIEKDLRLSKRIPVTHLNSPNVFETIDGMVGSVIALDGVPFDTETSAFIRQNHVAWQSAVKGLGEHIALYVTTHRQRVDTNLSGTFQDAFSQTLDNRHMSAMAHKGMYRQRIYVTLLYKGITFGKTGRLISFSRKVSEMSMKSARSAYRDKATKALVLARELFMSRMAAFKPVLLGSQDSQAGSSQLVRFLGLSINGGEMLAHPPLPSSAPYIGTSLQDTLKGNIAYPNGLLAQYLPRMRLYMGRAIQFQAAGRGDVFGAMLSIKAYSDASHPLILDNLMDLDTEWLSTHTFLPLSKDEALKQAKNRGIQLKSVEDASTSQIDDLTKLRDSIASGEVALGFHHHTLMLLSSDLPTLEKKVNGAISAYSAGGIVAVKEDIGQASAFFAQIPGNLSAISRSAIITHLNFTDFCPLHNYPAGYHGQNHLGSAVTILQTPAKTPYFFNYHLKGQGVHQITNGHTIIIGATGAGKTVLMAFLDAQMSRFGGKTFVFDRKRGLDTYIRAVGGYYTTLSPSEQSVQFNPLQLDDTPENRKFCTDWLKQLVIDEEQRHLSQETEEDIKACIDYAFDMLSKEHRTLSHVVKRLPTNFARWPSLRRWLRAHGKYGEGHYAYLFDNARDTFTLHHKMGFDLTYLLDNEPPSIRTAVMMYIMHRLKLSLDGTLMSIYLDEGWQYLDDPYWQKELEAFFGAFRSKNAHIIFATQSARSVVNSTMHGVIMSNVATKILFTNAEADAKDYMDGFHLTEEEYLAIKQSPADKRYFLVKQQDSCLCSLDLSAMADLLPVLSSNEASLRALDTLREKVGESPSTWLPIWLEEGKVS